ncbi:exodeoxyribonuclease VII large subunit [Alicyclobacillaceae bacterium I2511]|nr:exodeoxyribonuclease VII large subunit [Alicyclobacillaceae bacterium I2511]
MEILASTTAMQPVWTVSDLNTRIRDLLESNQELNRCHVSGEISNFKHHSSGHMYFTLKDEQSKVRAVMFASRVRFIKFVPQDGMKVIVRGAVSVFERDGSYQLYVENMQPDGIGALYVAFTQLKERLAKEGLFDHARKRTLVTYPRCVGVVTSSTGAVLRDIRSTLTRRYPALKIVLSPALVQGPGAVDSLISALARLNNYALTVFPVDVVIVARGGGSLEELWPFNEEKLARAIATFPIPVVSAVGHETDFTIADFVADVRAATPTAAAELVAPRLEDVDQQLVAMENHLHTWIIQEVARQKGRLVAIESHKVMQSPLQIVERLRQYVDYAESQVRHGYGTSLRKKLEGFNRWSERLSKTGISVQISRLQGQVERWAHNAEQGILTRRYGSQARFERTLASLEALNPLKVLLRGYSVVYRDHDNTVISSVLAVQPGEILRIRMSDGEFFTRVVEGAIADERGIQFRLDI